MGEVTQGRPPDLHILSAIAPSRKADSFHIRQVYAVVLVNFSEYAGITFSPIREVT